jgi:hypothetical protein
VRFQSLKSPARRAPWRPVMLAALLVLAAVAHAQSPLLNEVHTIATPATGVPIEQSVSIPAAGTYQVVLTDLGAASTPSAPLASVAMAVTTGDAIVGTPLVGAGTLPFTATAAGTYTLHIVGMPGAVPGSGPIGIVVSSSPGGATILSQSYNIALPPQAVPSATGVLNNSFSVPSSGNYQVSLNDLMVPQSLGGTLTLLLIAQGAQTPTLVLPTGSNALQATVGLQSGVTYRIFAIGQAGANATAGLYSAIVAPAGGGTSQSWVVPVGGTTLLSDAAVLSAGTQTLTATDLQFPAALSQLAAALVLNGQVSAQLSAAGATSFTASAGTYQAFGVATAAASPGGGSYAVQVQAQTGAPELNSAQAVVASGGTLNGYSFSTEISTAGTYTATLHDFEFPSILASGSLAAVQGLALVGTPISAPGSFTLKPAQGYLTLIAFAQGGQGGSLMDVNVADSAGTLVLDQPQGVGAAFGAQQFNVTTAGNYVVSATDLAFPAAFTSLSVIVTRGSTLLGSIFGGGSLPPIDATAGNYFVNIVAEPASSNANAAMPVNSGTYALNVAPAPSPPTVSFSADASSVTTGGTVHLIWTTSNATSCSGSGGGWSGTFTGAEAASDTVTSPTISTQTTFTLTCQGPGGSTAKSVTIPVTASSSGGGGGALGPAVLLWLCGCLLTRRARQDRRRA